MGEVVVTEFITLDGVVEDPGGAEVFEYAGWSFDFNRGEEGDQFKDEELKAADVQLLGRITYEGFAKAWPAMRNETGEFGERMNAMPKFVVSTTMPDEDATWENSTVIREDIRVRSSASRRRSKATSSSREARRWSEALRTPALSTGTA